MQSPLSIKAGLEKMETITNKTRSLTFTAQTESPKRHIFPFLLLPREIRDMIYDHLPYCDEALTVYKKKAASLWDAGNHDGADTSAHDGDLCVRLGKMATSLRPKLSTPTILLLNRQVYAEAMASFKPRALDMDVRLYSVHPPDWLGYPPPWCDSTLHLKYFLPSLKLLNVPTVNIRYKYSEFEIWERFWKEISGCIVNHYLQDRRLLPTSDTLHVTVEYDREQPEYFYSAPFHYEPALPRCYNDLGDTFCMLSLLGTLKRVTLEVPRSEKYEYFGISWSPVCQGPKWNSRSWTRRNFYDRS